MKLEASYYDDTTIILRAVLDGKEYSRFIEVNPVDLETFKRDVERFVDGELK